MAAYRLYLLNSEGHVAHRFDLPDYPDDAAAIAYASKAHNPHGIELWEGKRRLAAFPPLGDFPASS